MDRSSFWYWINGDGQWMDRLHCSGGDWLACGVQCCAAVVMFGYYIAYARRNHHALRYVKECHFRDHLIELRNVFVVCGAIHILSSVVAWWMPLYFVSSAMMTANTVQCHFLLRSKKEIQAIRQYYQGQAALEAVEDARRMLLETQAEGIELQIKKIREAFQDVV